MHVVWSIDPVSEKLDHNHREIKSLLVARDQWQTEKTDLITQLAQVSSTIYALLHYPEAVRNI